MSVAGLLTAMRDRWVVIAACVVLGVLLACSWVLVRPPQYAADTTLYVVAQSTDSPNAANSAYQGSLLSEQRVKSYTEIATGRRVMKMVIAQLRLADTPERLAGKVTATNGADSTVIKISTVDPDAQTAALLANTVSQDLVSVVNDLEKPPVPNMPPSVSIRQVRAAGVPMTPSTLGWPVWLALGIVGGLGLGGAAAVALSSLDTSVRSAEQTRRVSGAPHLASIAFDPALAAGGSSFDASSQSVQSESVRQLRTNLRFTDVDHKRKVMLVTSSRPGEGKTTTALGLASAMAAAGQRVALVDADLRRPRVADALQLEGQVGLTTVLTGQIALEDALQTMSGSTVTVITSGKLPPNPSEVLACAQMADFIETLRSRFDVVLFDTPPLLAVTDAAALSPLVDGAVLACRYGKTKEAELRSTSNALRTVESKIFGIVLTMTPASRQGSYDRYTTRDAVSTARPVTPAMHAAPSASAGTGAHQRPTLRPSVPPSPAPALRSSRSDPEDSRTAQADEAETETLVMGSTQRMARPRAPRSMKDPRRLRSRSHGDAEPTERQS